MRLKKCVKTHFAEVGMRWDEFHIRSQYIPGTCPSDRKGFVSYMKLSTWNDTTTKLPHTLDLSWVLSQCWMTSNKYCGAVPWLMKHWNTQIKLNSARHWYPVELLQERWCMRLGRSTTEKSSSSILHTLQTVECGLRAAGKQTVEIIQTWQYQCMYHLI